MASSLGARPHRRPMLCYVGRIEEASSVRPDIYSYAAVIDGFCKVGRTDEAMYMLRDAVKMGLKPNVVTYNMFFDGYRREGRTLEGISVLKRMKEGGCLPDCICYNTLIHGLLKWGEVRSAVSVYKEMATEGFRVDYMIGSSLLRKLCRLSWREKDLLEDAYVVFDSMRDGDLVIDG